MCNIQDKALRKIIELTEGYDEYGIPVAYGCNVIAKLALGIPVQVHNHVDDEFHSDCVRCIEYMKQFNK